MDLRPLLKPRHLALTLAVAVVAGATLVAATAGPDAARVPAALAGPVSIPLPADGDRGLYAIHNDPAGDDPSAWGEPDQTLRFAWGADRLMRNATGGLHWTNTLWTQDSRSDAQGGQTFNETIHLYAGTMRQLGASHDFSQHVADEEPATLATRWTSSSASNVTFLADHPAWGATVCLRFALQGTAVHLGRTHHPLDPACVWLTQGLPGTTMRLEAVGGLPGERDLLFVSEDENLLGYPVTLGRVWFREGLPYPIRIEQTDELGDAYTVAVLGEFDAGRTPLRTESGANGPPLPTLVMRPLPAWTLDDAGVDHPFPLSRAFTAARDDAAYDDLRRFLDDHPDGYVAWARLAQGTLPQSTWVRWEFGVTEGTRVLPVSVEMRRSVLAAPGGIILEDARPPAVTVGPGPEQSPFFEVTSYLAPEERPQELPSVASLLARWRSHSGDTAPGDSWGFFLVRDPDGEGGFPGLYVQAGREQQTREDTPGGVVVGGVTPQSTRAVAATASWYDGFDDLDRLSWTESEASEDMADVPLAASALPQEQSTAGRAAAATQVRADRSLLHLTPLERATIGAGAALAALTYWLGPVAKDALVGLFSRIRDDRLLEHPARRHARDLVEQNPGIHHQELVRRLGKGKGGAEHHLRKLEDAGLLVVRRSSGYTCYFVPGQATRHASAAAPLLKSPVAQGIVQAMTAQPGITHAELARRLDVRPATIHYHVTRLRAGGLLPPPVPDGSAAAVAA